MQQEKEREEESEIERGGERDLIRLYANFGISVVEKILCYNEALLYRVLLYTKTISTPHFG